MKPLSAESERRILTALEKVADLVNDGTNPDDAITKVASEAKLPHGHVPLMVYAYNTGRTTIQRNTGETTEEKAAEFPLANTTAILDKMFVNATKTATETYLADTVADEYDKPPIVTREMFKAACQTVGQCREPVLIPGREYKLAALKLDKTRREVEESRRELAQAHDSLIDSMCEFAREVKYASPAQRGDIFENVSLLHGSAGDELLAFATQYSGSLKKEASNVLSCVDGSVYGTVAECISKAKHYHQKKAEHEQTKQILADMDASIKESHGVKYTWTSDSELLQGMDEGEKSAGFFSTAAGTGAALSARDLMSSTTSRVLGTDESLSKHIGSQALELEDPAHESEMRKIQAESMLSDLMANDEVISGYDPEDVTRAFNEMVQVSPRVATSSLAMRALLRKKLTQGNLEPFEVAELANTETKLKQRDEPHGLAGQLFNTREVPRKA